MEFDLYLNVGPILLSLFILLSSGFSIIFLINPRKLWQNFIEMRFFDIFIMSLALGFGYNSFLGYIIDFFFELTIKTYLNCFILFISFIAIIRYDSIYLWVKRVYRRELQFHFNFNWSINLKEIFFFLVISGIFIVNIFYLTFEKYSLPLNDPIFTYENIVLSIRSKQINWGGQSVNIDIIDSSQTYYPIGFYVNLVFLCIFDENNAFIIVKFFGPLISTLTMITFYSILKSLSKTPVAPLVGIVVWVGTNINTMYSMMSLAPILGLMVAMVGIKIIIKRTYFDDIISGIIIGSGFLIHPFTGGLFIFIGIIVYLLFNNHYLNQSTKKKRIFSFIIPLFLTIIPYLIVFKFRSFSILGLITNRNLSSFSLVIYSLSSFFGLYTEHFIDIPNQFVLYGISSNALFLITFFILIFFVKNKRDMIFQFQIQVIPLFLGMGLFSLLYLINPFVINGIILHFYFDEIYVAFRSIWFLSITICFIITISIDNLIIFLDWLVQKYKIEKRFHSSKISYFFLILIIVTELNCTYYCIDQSHTVGLCSGFSEYFIDPEYTETVLWIGKNAEKDQKVIFNYENWVRLSLTVSRGAEKIEAFNYGAAPLQKIYFNSTFYEFLWNSSDPLNSVRAIEFLNYTQFFNYNYIVFPYSEGFEVYAPLLLNECLEFIFLSKGEKYSVYRINTPFENYNDLNCLLPLYMN